MDLRLLAAEPTAAERAAVDAVVGGPPADTGRAVAGGRAARERRHLLLPALHALRDASGWITEGGLGYVCERLTVPPAEAYGVATFYALLGTGDRPERVVHVCDDVVCAVAAGPEIERLTADGLTVERSPCLGTCTAAPGTLEDRVGSPLGSSADPAPVPQDRDDLRILKRVGVVDPSSLDDYRAHGGFSALEQARDLGPEKVIAEVEAARLRGRGGAAFPVAAKWKAVSTAPGASRHVIANGDESEPGTFKDRALMEGDPYAVIEGLLVAAYATGAADGWVYVRAEYPTAIARLREAISHVEDAGLAEDVGLHLRVGAGAYVCGEETALIESIEGHRGEPRQRPPFPTAHGLFGLPTAVNNVETLATVLDVLVRGAEAFTSEGTRESAGRKLFPVSGAVGSPGVYEVPLGTPLADLIEVAGGFVGEPGAVLLGGAAGTFIAPDGFGLPLSFEDAADHGSPLGAGAVIAFDAATDFGAVTRRIAAFFRDESCGKCVPCRVGTVRQEEALLRLAAGAPLGSVGEELLLLGDLDAVMTDASICGLGRTAASAVRSAIALGLPGVVE